MNGEHEQPKKKLSRRELFVKAGSVMAESVAKSVLIGSIPTSLVVLTEALPQLYEQRDRYLRELFDTQHESDAVIEKAQRFLEAMYHVRIEFGIHSEDEHYAGALWRGEGLSVEEARNALTTLFGIFGRYPVDFFIRNRIRQFTIAKDLTKIPHGNEELSEPAGGAFFPSRDAIAVHFDPEYGFDERTVHHELYHMLDYREGGYDPENQAWMDLMAQCSCGTYGEQDPALPGFPFTTEYGATSPIEDRAEFASFMLTPTAHAMFSARMNGEPDGVGRTTLLEKYQRIKSDYLRWSGGSMNQNYWDSIIEIGQREIGWIPPVPGERGAASPD